jgi:AraC family transcriptional regulator of adaptative response / DNA-3-methyladenine glycosylase II
MCRRFSIYKHADCSLAKNLLIDTDLSVLEIAMASGFGSLRRFNGLFKKQYKLSPTALRKRNAEEKNIKTTLHYH